MRVPYLLVYIIYSSTVPKESQTSHSKMEGGGILWLRAHIADAYHGSYIAVMRGYLQLSGADMRVAYAFTINANIPPLQSPPVLQMML
jgi:hypothetical protein